mgnify:CR=1 FL=1
MTLRVGARRGAAGDTRVRERAIDERWALLVIPLIVGLGLVLAALSASFAIRRWLRT